MAITKADEEFLKKLNEIVQANIQNPDFSLLDMADQLCMSRSSLNRKIKGILDVTPNDYIRIERLKKAAQLLKEGNCKINEVCYMVGLIRHLILPNVFRNNLECYLKILQEINNRFFIKNVFMQRICHEI